MCGYITVVYTDHDEIWHRVCHGSALTYQMWPRSEMGVSTGVPKFENLVKIGFGSFSGLLFSSPLLWQLHVGYEKYAVF